MPQFFVPKKSLKHRPFFFDESESNHLSSVLRKKPGDEVQVFDGEGSIYLARLLDVSNPARVTAELLQDEPAGPSLQKPSSKISVTVSPALIKGPRFDWLLEKSTEMGVDRIIPIVTERTIVDFKQSQSDSKLRRWNQILLASAKQCQRPALPELRAPASFAEALKQMPSESLGVILWEREEVRFLSKFMAEQRARNPERLNIHLFTGPEGGWTSREIDAAKAAGVQPVRLGELILRAETATLSALSLILF